MILPDVNVLIYAFRKDTAQHLLCRAWLEKTIFRNSRFAISNLVLSAVVRIATNARAFTTPSTSAETFAFCENLLGQPHCQVVEPGVRHWSIFKQLCTDTGTIGPRVSDAWFAAMAIEWGCEWITLDRDYARFPGLKWSTPSAAP